MSAVQKTTLKRPRPASKSPSRQPSPIASTSRSPESGMGSGSSTRSPWRRQQMPDLSPAALKALGRFPIAPPRTPQPMPHPVGYIELEDSPYFPGADDMLLASPPSPATKAKPPPLNFRLHPSPQYHSPVHTGYVWADTDDEDAISLWRYRSPEPELSSPENQFSSSDDASEPEFSSPEPSPVRKPPPMNDGVKRRCVRTDDY